MIDFVLNRPGQEPVDLESTQVACQILKLDMSVFGSLDFLGNSGYRQTALDIAILAAARQNPGVDQDVEVTGLFADRDVDHRQAGLDADLGRREPNPGSRVHGLRHVIGESGQLVIELRYLRALDPQYGIRVELDLQHGHRSLLQVRDRTPDDLVVALTSEDIEQAARVRFTLDKKRNAVSVQLE